MLYRKSQYTIEFVESINQREERFLYNTMTGVLALINEENYAIYSKLPCELDVNNTEAKILIENGFAVETDKNEYEVVLINSNMSRYSGHVLKLTIAPTLDCNMRCAYCFEEKRNIVMTTAVADAIAVFVQRKAEEEIIKDIDVVWYGGEPLLEPDMICYLSEKLINLAEQKGIRYKSSIVTNGVYFVQESALQLAEKCKISEAQITLDGIGNIHNCRRKTVDGSDSFDIITRNIAKSCDFVKMTVRINVDKRNENEIYRLTDFLMKDMGLKGKIRVCVSKVIGDADYCFTQKEFSNIEFRFMQYMLEKGYIEWEEFATFNSSGCVCSSVGINSYVIDPQGFLYTCWNNIGIQTLNIGNVAEGEIYSKNYNKWLLYNFEEECKKCAYLPLCCGGCPYSVIHRKKAECATIALNLLKYQRLICRKMLEEPIRC